jgi:hypothetical protein
MPLEDMEITLIESLKLNSLTRLPRKLPHQSSTLIVVY